MDAAVHVGFVLLKAEGDYLHTAHVQNVSTVIAYGPSGYWAWAHQSAGVCIDQPIQLLISMRHWVSAILVLRGAMDQVYHGTAHYLF